MKHNILNYLLYKNDHWYITHSFYSSLGLIILEETRFEREGEIWMLYYQDFESLIEYLLYLLSLASSLIPLLRPDGG